MTRSRFGLTAFVASVLVVTLGVALVEQALAVKGNTSIISEASDGTAGDDYSYFASISADGRYVAFASEANNLSTADNNAVTNIFVRDLQVQATTYVSKATDGTAADDYSYSPSISADGRYVAFESDADSLSTNDNNAVTNIFVHDLQSQTTTYVSKASDGTAGDDGSGRPSISADGRYVAFESDADSLSTTDNNAVTNIFVHDLQSQTTTYVSKASDGTAGDRGSSTPSISADGRYVAFESDADKLSTTDNNAFVNIFVHDLQTQTTTYVSKASGGTAADDYSYSPSISADGRYVAFESDANSLSTADNNAVRNIFVHDLRTETTTFVSKASDGTAGDAYSYSASISADGRYLAFESDANSLSTADNNIFTNIFVHDLRTQTTSYVSRASDGTAGDGGSAAPSISADGRYVAFTSDADNLSTADNNAFVNIFVHTYLPDPPQNLTPPKMTGQPVSGKTLSCDPGEWTDGSFAFAWRRDGTPIAGATLNSHALAAADVGHIIDCRVTATNADGVAAQTSNQNLVSEPLSGPAGPAGSDGAEGKDGATGPAGQDGAAGPRGVAAEPVTKLLLVIGADKFTATTGKKLIARYATSGPGEVKATLKGIKGKAKGTTLTKKRTLGESGPAKLAIKLRAQKKPGSKRRPVRKGAYRLHLQITGIDGQQAFDTAKVKVKKPGKRSP